MKSARLAWAALLIVSIRAHGQLSPAQQSAVPFIAKPEEIALKHPKAEYPRALRARHITGAGVFEVTVDSPSGTVIDVRTVKSTGSKVLDRCAIESLKRWIFRPDTVRRANIGVAFTLKAH